MKQNALSIKKKTDKINFTEIRIVGSSKDIIEKMNRQATHWKIQFVVHISDKDSYSEYIKNSYKPRIKDKQPMKNWQHF